MKEKKQNVKNETAQEESINNSSRRGFLGHLTKAGIAAAAVGAIGAKPFLGGKESVALAAQPRRNASQKFRDDASKFNFQNTPANLNRPSNGDEALYPNRIGNYSKGMPHQANGEVDPAAYNLLLTAINSGSPADFGNIPKGVIGGRNQTNPQGGYAFDLEGRDAFSLTMPPAPAFASAEIAAEIAENYWMALLRDVPFNEYATNGIAFDAAADLNQYGAAFKGPKVGGVVTPTNLFRGLTPGDLNGPWLSQFFVKELNFGANRIDQRTRTVLPVGGGGQNYMTTFASWLAVQRGAVQPPDIFDPQVRYMRNGRDTGQWVHVDALYQGYVHAVLILLGLNAPVDAGNPYNVPPQSNNQDGFGTFGGPHILSLVTEVATRALHAVWNQKWVVHRRLRPEVFAARVHRTINNGAGYPIDASIINSIASGTRLGAYLPAGNALLPMAFPEGSPTHPAYGAGHATVAGACTTILKAWFDESWEIPAPMVVTDASGLGLSPYVGDPLTVGGELNKVASNVANSRNIAGVHWRSDSIESLRLGEKVAISILRDQKASYNEPFNGFSLTTFDGNTITV